MDSKAKITDTLMRRMGFHLVVQDREGFAGDVPLQASGHSKRSESASESEPREPAIGAKA